MYSRRVKCIVFLLLSVALDPANSLCQIPKRHFTVADDIGLAHFGDQYWLQADAVTFSPDERYFVVDTERGLLDEDRPESTLRIYRTGDIHQFLLRPDLTSEPLPLWMFSKSTYKD